MSSAAEYVAVKFALDELVRRVQRLAAERDELRAERDELRSRIEAAGRALAGEKVCDE